MGKGGGVPLGNGNDMSIPESGHLWPSTLAHSYPTAAWKHWLGSLRIQDANPESVTC